MLKSKNDQGMIENKLIWYQKYDTFETERLHGSIDPKSIVFVAEGRTENEGPFIYTHGYEFSANSVSNYVHNKVEGDINNISQALSDQLADLGRLIEREHAGITDGARKRLDALLASLAAAELTINYLLEHGSDDDKTEYLIGILNSELGKINSILVEYRERISVVEGLYEQYMSATDIEEKIRSEYEKIINLAKGFVQEEFRKMNLDEQIVQTVGRYMESGLLKDYVTYALLGDTNTITSLAELILLATDTFASVKQIASWRSEDGKNIVETISALLNFADQYSSSWLLTAQYSSEKDLAAHIFGYADQFDSFIELVANKITFDTSRLLFKLGNNRILIDNNGIKHYVEGSSPEISSFFLGNDGTGYLGKNHQIEWNDRGVKVQKDTIYDGDSPFDWDNIGSYVELAFTVAPDTDNLDSACLPPNSLWPTTGNKELTKTIGTKTYVWTKSATNVQDGYKIWMALRRLKNDGTLLSNGKSNWEGPYCISGAGGVLGVDSDFIKFMYARTDSGVNGPTAPSSVDKNATNSGVWYDDATNANVALQKDKTVWMAYSTTRDGDNFTNFRGPILWAQWGHDAIDGDGVQYIFTVTLSNFGAWPTNKQHQYYNNNPSLWPAKGTSLSLGEEFIGDTLDHKNVTWHDNPQELHQGETQWVCVRTYKHSTGWSAYSQPSVWAYYSKDGVTSGYIVDFSNSNIPVTTDVNGFLSADRGAEAEDRYPVFDHTVSLYVYTSVGGNVPIEITEGQGVNTSGLRYSAELDPNDAYVAASRPAPADLDNLSETLTNWFELELSQDTSEDPYHTYIRVIIHNLNEANITDPESLRDKHLYIPVVVTIKPDSNPDHNVVIRKELSIYGVYTGADGIPGLTMDLRCDTSTVSRDRYNAASNEPSTVTPYVYFALGTTVYDKMYATVHSGENFPGGVDRDDYEIKYKHGASDTWTLLSGSDTINTAGNTPLYIGLFYKGTLIDTKTISYVLSGQKGDTVNGIGKFISTVFCRTNETPAAPTGGSWPDGFPNDDRVYKASDNSVIDGVRWHDGLPSGNTKLWASLRVFYSDGSHDTTNPTWSNPIEMTDIKNLYDVEFSTEETYTDDPDNAPSEWFDPTTKLYKDGVNTYDGDWTDVIWRAEQFIINGDVTDWIITKIKGEQGDPGVSKFKSTIFTRCSVPEGIVVLAPNYNEIVVGGIGTGEYKDNSSSYNNPVPQGNSSHVKTTTDSNYTNPWPTYVGGAHIQWHDEIPDGGEQLWACTGMFEEGVVGTVWSEPKRMTDTETYDVEFSNVESTDPPHEPDYDSTSAYYNTAGSSNQIWFDPEETLPSGVHWSDMIWRAERSIKNGVAGDWTILRIKGELGTSSSGYRLEASRTSVEMAYSEYGDLLQLPTEVVFTLYKDGQITNEAWTLNTNISDLSYITVNQHVATIKKVPGDINSNVLVVEFWAEDQNGNTIGRLDLTLSRKIVAEFEPVVNTTKVIFSNGQCSPSNLIVRLRKTNFAAGTIEYVDFDDSPWNASVTPQLNTGVGNGTSTKVWSLSGVVYNTIKDGINVSITKNGTIEYSIDIPVEYNATLGSTGKMFYMCGEYSEAVSEGVKNYYERTNDYIPLVHFTARGEEEGSWYILNAEKNYGGSNPQTSPQTRYAPGEYDVFGKHYSYAANIWEKAEQFSVVITEGIFSEFAKLGSAIISGDFIMSKHGKMLMYSDNSLSASSYITVPDSLNDGVEFKNKEYLYFSPEKQEIIRQGSFTLSSGTLSRHEKIIYVPAGCLLKGKLTLTGGWVHNAGEARLVLVDESGNAISTYPNGDPVPTTSLSSGTYTQSTVNGARVYEYEINISALDDQRRYKLEFYSGTNMQYTASYIANMKIVHDYYYGVFEPAWCVDLKTGKMIAGGGSFVVQPDGDISIGEGLVKWQQGAIDQLSMHDRSTNDTLLYMSSGSLGGSVTAIGKELNNYKSTSSLSSTSNAASLTLETRYNNAVHKSVTIRTTEPAIIFKDGTEEHTLTSNIVKWLIQKYNSEQ